MRALSNGKTEQRCYGKPKGKEDDDEPGNGGDDSDQQGGEQGASLDLEDYRGIAAFHAERIDASNVEIRWANPRAFWETFELRRRSSDSGDWIVIHSGVLSIGNIVEFTDEAADPACQYELAVIDGHGRPVSYGPIAPLESHSATAEEAFAELQRDPEPTSVARAGGHSSRGSLGLLALVLLLLSSGVARLAFARSVR